MGSLSLARFLNYFWFRLAKIFLWLELSAGLTLIFIGAQWLQVKKHEYDYFQLDVYYSHHLNAFHFLATLMTLILSLIYLWVIKDSKEDVFLLVFLSRIKLTLFHLIVLTLGLLIWVFWLYLVWQLMGSYFNQTIKVPWRLFLHLMMDGMILFAISQFLPTKIPLIMYGIFKMIVLTIGFEGDYKPYIYGVLNYVHFDKTWQYPWASLKGISIIFLIYALGFLKFKMNRRI